MNTRERNATLFLCNKQNKQEYGLRMKMVKSVLPLDFDHRSLSVCVSKCWNHFHPVSIRCAHIRIIKKGKHQPNLFYRKARPLFFVSFNIQRTFRLKAAFANFSFHFRALFSLSIPLFFASSFVSKFRYLLNSSFIFCCCCFYPNVQDALISNTI